MTGGAPGSTGLDVAERIERGITHLVQIAPEHDAGVARALVADLAAVGAPLAAAIAEVLARVVAQQIAPGIALPALAMACATLAGGLRGQLGDRELEAARYEIDTLLPVPARLARAAAPDVLLTALRKRSP